MTKTYEYMYIADSGEMIVCAASSHAKAVEIVEKEMGAKINPADIERF